MFLRLIKILLLVLVYAFMAFGQSNGIISDEIIVPPNYSSFVPEDNIGSEYIDPAFGTKVKRITNCGLIDGDALGGYFSNSEICAFNVDGSYFIATENIETDGIKSLAGFLYDGNTGERIKLLGRDTMRPWYIRWAIANKYKKDGEYIRFEPKYCFYRFIKNEIRLYDIRDVDNYVVLRTFPEYYEIGPAGGEGDLSDDGRYWCLD
jgi:hypothetical protein